MKQQTSHCKKARLSGEGYATVSCRWYSSFSYWPLYGGPITENNFERIEPEGERTLTND